MFGDLPIFKDQMTISFSHDGNLKYRRKANDQNTFNTLDEVFSVIPSDQVVQIEVKDQHDEEALRKTIQIV